MVPTKTRRPSCYLLEVGNKRILFDAGHNSTGRLAEMGIDLQSIDILFISHFHTDHFSDAMPLVHSRWVDDIYHPERGHKELTIIGPESLEERWKKLREVFWVEPQEPYPLKFVEGVKKIKIDDIEIELFEIKHVQWYQSLGIKIKFEGKSVVYTGDVGGENNLQYLKDMAKDIDLLMIEAGCADPSPTHLTIDQVIEISNDANVGKTVATHIRDENLQIFKEKTRKYDRITLAEDLMKIEI